MKKKILHLTLKKIYFDQIVHGIKKEEYRDVKKYWLSRLYNKYYYVKTFDEIHFRNGYRKGSPFMRVVFKGTTQGKIKGEDKFVIKLGKILEIKNWKKREESKWSKNYHIQ